MLGRLGTRTASGRRPPAAGCRRPRPCPPPSGCRARSGRGSRGGPRSGRRGRRRCRRRGPCPGSASRSRARRGRPRAHLEDVAVLRVVLGVDVGLVPGAERLQALRDRVAGVDDLRVELAGPVAEELGADQGDVRLRVEEAGRGAMDRTNRRLRPRSRRGLSPAPARSLGVGVDHQGVELGEVRRVQVSTSSVYATSIPRPAMTGSAARSAGRWRPRSPRNRARKVVGAVEVPAVVPGSRAGRRDRAGSPGDPHRRPSHESSHSNGAAGWRAGLDPG